MTIFILLKDNGSPYGESIVRVFDTLDKAKEYRDCMPKPNDFDIEEWDVD